MALSNHSWFNVGDWRYLSTGERYRGPAAIIILADDVYYFDEWGRELLPAVKESVLTPEETFWLSFERSEVNNG